MKTKLPKPSLIRKTKIKLFLSLLFFFFFSIVHSQLSGTYTIGTSQDYDNFTEAVEALKLYGVNSAVIFNVVSGTYTEQPVLTSISGTSETNTVTFQSQSGDSTTVILQFDDTEYANNYVLKIDGADFVTFKNLTFKAFGDDLYGTAIKLAGHCHDITFTNNEFYGIDANDAHASKIIFRASLEESKANSYNITINNNRFHKGGYAIYLQGDNTVYLSGSYISGNTFVETGYTGVFCNHNYAPVITYNTIDAGSYGIRVNGNYGGGDYSFNHINAGHRGMDIQRIGFTGERAMISNNLISIGEHGSYGLSIANSVMTDIFYNSVYVNSNSVVSAAFYSAGGVATGSTVNVRNNNFANENGGYAVLVQTPGVITSMDHNNLYTAGNYISAWNNVKIFDLFDLQAASGLNSASLTVYPHYIADDDPHTTAAWLDNTGVPIPDIDVDFDGEMRHATTPDIGADEFTADPSTTTPLSGTYTIGSGGNYPTISSAFEDALMKGVSAEIIFSLLDGTYNEQLVLRSIPGAGMDRRITLTSQSGKPEDAIISYASDDYYANWVMQLHGADFITIQNLTVKAEGSTYARVIDLWQGADSVEIRGNILEGTVANGNQANYAVIYSGDSDYRNRLIEENFLKRGTFGVFMRRDQNNYQYARGAEIKDNTITENGYTGIHLQFYDAPFISGNNIEAPSNGIRALSCSNDLVISKNIIKVDYDKGIQLSTCYATEEKKGIISNNFIHIGGNSGVEGIYINNSSNQLILNNSVHLTNTAATSKAFYISSGGSSSVTILNNIFANTGGGYSYYVTTPATVVGSDYNDLYSTGGLLAYWGANAEDMEALRAASNMEEHSISMHPQFNTDTDLHTMAAALDSAGVSLAAVPDDIDGEPRHLLYPDIGADEFSFFENNPPIAVNDTITTAIEITIYPLLNDDDIDDDTFTITEISTPNQGTASIMEGDTTILYTPVSYSPQYDTIQYIIQDNNGGLDTAQIFITLYRLMTGFTRMDYEIHNVSRGSGKFGDYDNDGDLDILMTGWIGTNQDYISSIYKNTGGEFEEMQAGLSGVSPGTPNAVSWIDYDNDNDLDLIIMGRLNNTLDEYSTIFYENIENSFTESADASIEVNMSSGSVDWGDYNNDGKYDLLISGKPESGSSITEVYKNLGADPTTGKWKLEKVETNLTGIWGGESNWIDFDSDGDLDIFICGFGADPSELYQNDRGVFSLITTDIAGVGNAASDWGDYDSDGDLDLILTGGDQTYLSKIYRNDGSAGENQWAFTDINANLEQINGGDVAWGDLDNDGDLDLVLSGNISMLNSVSILYENEDGNFVNSTVNIIDLGRTAISLGDYDNDGDLDLLMSGYSPSEMEHLSILYQNNATEINEAPSPPLNLTAFEHGDTITFSWNQSQDDYTILDALTYNLRIGTEAGKNDILSPMSSSEGYRKIVKTGNTGHSISWDIRGLPGETTYYWSVQAVDQAFMGSEFASEQYIMFTAIDDNTYNTFQLEQVYPNPFSSLTNIRFFMPEQANSRIEIFDLTGQKITELLNNNLAPGTHEIIWQANNCPAGIYFLKLSVGNQIAIKKVVKTK